MMLGWSGWSRLASLPLSVWAWLTDSTVHLLLGLCVLIAAWGVWQRHQRLNEAAAVAAWPAAFAREQAAFVTLAGAIATQNRAIGLWAQAGQARGAAAQEALRAADTRSLGRTAAAAAIRNDSALPAPAGQLCRTSQAVLNERGKL